MEDSDYRNLFSHPAHYQIQIAGKPSEMLHNQFEGWEILCAKNLTTLIGWIPDQVALVSTLMVLHDMHYTITELKLIEGENM